jgi:hypothetical protein
LSHISRYLLTYTFLLYKQDISKRKIYDSNGISAEKFSISNSENLSVKSKAKLNGAFSLTDLKDDTFRNNGKR